MRRSRLGGSFEFQVRSFELGVITLPGIIPSSPARLSSFSPANVVVGLDGLVEFFDEELAKVEDLQKVSGFLNVQFCHTKEQRLSLRSSLAD